RTLQYLDALEIRDVGTGGARIWRAIDEEQARGHGKTTKREVGAAAVHPTVAADPGGETWRVPGELDDVLDADVLDGVRGQRRDCDRHLHEVFVGSARG